MDTEFTRHLEEINLHPKSIKRINEVNALYAPLAKPINRHTSETDELIIIQLYPYEDTIDSDGQMNGYVDFLFFKIKVFFPKTMNFMNIINKDGIHFSKVYIDSIHIFKDGSTYIEITGKYTYLFETQCIVVCKA